MVDQIKYKSGILWFHVQCRCENCILHIHEKKALLLLTSFQMRLKNIMIMLLLLFEFFFYNLLMLFTNKRMPCFFLRVQNKKIISIPFHKIKLFCTHREMKSTCHSAVNTSHFHLGTCVKYVSSGKVAFLTTFNSSTLSAVYIIAIALN